MSSQKIFHVETTGEGLVTVGATSVSEARALVQQDIETEAFGGSGLGIEPTKATAIGTSTRFAWGQLLWITMPGVSS